MTQTTITPELKAYLNQAAKAHDLKQLQLQIEGHHGTEIKMSRICDELKTWIGPKIYEHFEHNEQSSLFVCLAAIYAASQLDGGKARWRDKVTPISEGVAYQRADNSLRDNKDKLAPLFTLFQLLAEHEGTKEAKLFLPGKELFTPYIDQTQELELAVQNYLNKHQRVHHDFHNELTVMDDGLTEAIADANVIVQKALKHIGANTHDSAIINTLKSLDLHRSQNELMCLVQSAQENAKCDWFNGEKYIAAYRAFNRLDEIEFILAKVFDKKTPNGFMDAVNTMLSGHVQQRSWSRIREHVAANPRKSILLIAWEMKEINAYSFFNMAFVLMSLYTNKTKLYVKVTGENNHNRTVYTDIKNMVQRIQNSQAEKVPFDVRIDLEEYVYDKVTMLATCEPEYCIETGNSALLEKGIKAYGNYRKTKFEYIGEVNKFLLEHELNLVNELTYAFRTELALLEQQPTRF
ncbi:hypothetical protein ACED51_10515 [Photobacterium swingsii]|uniref:Uncharacterized protein n=2 Tax=Vibrio TaxID=662 RepID=A0A0H3ZQB8_9VIBR|nr:hypothetical protein [Vibrio tasmaniensis]AKN40822.1 hypothetical protein [Vibrio sp. 1F_189]